VKARTKAFKTIAATLVCCAWALAADVPRVEFDTSQLKPRPMEDVTARNIPRDYGRAWQTIEAALDQNQPRFLDSYLTGTALDKYKERVASQQKSGLHARYLDHGHKADAVFYSPDGGTVELHDTAQLEIQILDGTTIVHDENVTLRYLAVMTPAADRWNVRLLESVQKF